ncbi:MAG: glycosyltransferase family 2 protein [Bacteroidetes bacterium]|nr:glycosyltransferase family 2 protein [Bacteroidota bacterium]
MEETVSVVIPTCDRKQRLITLLHCLEAQSYPLLEVIVVDAGDDRLSDSDLALFTKFPLHYFAAPRAVCIQRNMGIRAARGKWIFLCDDDIEVPADYLPLLLAHQQAHPEAGALSGRVLQQTAGGWAGSYPVQSGRELLWAWFFRLSIWGEIKLKRENVLLKKIQRSYALRGNHISGAGWPVLTDFSGDFFVSPVFGLGASLVKKDWLLATPYDEVLDAHGIGDNYGVSVEFPTGVHVVNRAFVYHHQEEVNRLQRPLQYYRRALALEYFIRTKPVLHKVKKTSLLWSLSGNLLRFIVVGDRMMIKAAWRTVWTIAIGRNPYCQAALQKNKTAEPML